MQNKIYTEGTGDISHLKDKTIAVIGYGNQGRSQALNLRDSGLDIIVGNREDDYLKIAKRDAFTTFSIAEATKQADILLLLLPDEIVPEIFEKEIRPSLRENACLVFAHGYSVAFGLLTPPKEVDVLLIAPRMIGVGVRETYLTGEGYYSFVAVHQNHSGKAKELLLALCQGLGTLKKGAVELSFKEEAVLDLFNEQAFGPAFGRVLLSSIFTLIDAGYPPEAVFIEMYLSGEMEYTYQKFRKIGLVEQVNFHSHTSQYGAMSRGAKFLKLPIGKIQKKILKNIESGAFAREWERPISKTKFKFLKFFAKRTRIKRQEKKVRKSLGLPIKSFFEATDELESKRKKLSKEVQEELATLEEYYNNL